MKKFVIAACTLTVSALSAGSAYAQAGSDPITIRNPGGDHDIDCRGEKIVISGPSNNVRLRNCPDVVVSGSSNNVWIGSARGVKVPGASNDVRAEFSADGWVQVDGSSNDVVIVAPRNITVNTGNRGIGNTVTRRYR